MIPIPQDFQEFIRLLNEYKAEYLLIGGYAIAFHGYVRYTGNIDFFISPEKENAKKVFQVFKDFGFKDDALSVDLFMEEGNIIRIGSEPMRLEVANKIDGVTFNECFKNKKVLNLEGLEINFINLNDLIKNKSSTGRTKDKADAEELIKIRSIGNKEK